MNSEQKARLVRIINNGCKAGTSHVLIDDAGDECHCIVMDMVLDCPPVKVDNLTTVCRTNNNKFIHEASMLLVREVLCREFGLTLTQLQELQNANDDYAGTDPQDIAPRRSHILEQLSNFPVEETP